MKRFIYFLVVIIILGAILFITRKDEEVQLTRVIVGHIGLANDLPAFIAFEKGFFREEGLDVELRKLESSKLASDALYAGGIDISAGSSLVNLLGAEANDPGKIMFYALGRTGKSENTTLGGFIVLETSSINTVADLAGKKIAVFPGNTATSFLTRYFKKNGVDPDTVLWQKMVPSNWLPSLDSGAVDAVYAYEPTYTLAKLRTENKVRVIAFGALEDEVDPLYLGGSTFAVRFVADNPDAAASYVRAFYRGIDFINTNESEARAILQSYINVPTEVAMNMNLYPDDKVDAIQRDKFQELSNLLFEEGTLPNAVNVMRDELYYVLP
ncbi:MAG: ABC transporter substrate-binding protein [Candidatus Niyogibacteria bacterium]|nr:ABC transporter substrate-binding protein [Candidatus Niyogibacteria bacterium]